MKKLINTTKVVVTVGALALSYVMGERIERIVQENDSITTEDKPMVTAISCTSVGCIIGLIARRVVKHINNKEVR